MPRRPRMYLPGIPAHIVQRGINRAPCFFRENDYRIYLNALDTALKRYRVSLHAFVLMTNHVHLLMTPEDEDGISRVMALLGSYYVRYVNKTYERTGTLWEGRHHSSLIETSSYLFRCYRYIELNPCRARVVKRPDAYPWSSYAHNAGGSLESTIIEHDEYRSLGGCPSVRQQTYRGFFAEELSEQDVCEFREASTYNYPLGSEGFRKNIERQLGRPIGHCRVGRPFSKGGQK